MRISDWSSDVCSSDLTALDECGNLPASGADDAVVATDGFISLTLTSEIEEGTEIITRKADGSLCVNERTSDSFKRFRSEEHTSELQSLMRISYAVFCLKKKTNKKPSIRHTAKQQSKKL